MIVVFMAAMEVVRVIASLIVLVAATVDVVAVAIIHVQAHARAVALRDVLTLAQILASIRVH